MASVGLPLVVWSNVQSAQKELRQFGGISFFRSRVFGGFPWDPSAGVRGCRHDRARIDRRGRRIAGVCARCDAPDARRAADAAGGEGTSGAAKGASEDVRGCPRMSDLRPKSSHFDGAGATGLPAAGNVSDANETNPIRANANRGPASWNRGNARSAGARRRRNEANDGAQTTRHARSRLGIPAAACRSSALRRFRKV